MRQDMAILTSHNTAEWYTPPEYISLVVQVLGGIDLDPASDPLPQTWIQAGTYFTKEDDGLGKSWFGKVFLNPPYGKTAGKSNAEVWSQKLIKEYRSKNVEEAILLVNATNGYKWFEALWAEFPVCFTRDRIRFVKPDGTVGGQAKRAQCFFYFGQDVYRFYNIFSGIGRVILSEDGGSGRIHERFQFCRDEDCHDYLVPERLVAEFYSAMEKLYEYDDYKDWNNGNFDSYRCNYPTQYTFCDPKLDI